LAALLFAECCGDANCLSTRSACCHDPSGSEGDVTRADDPSGEEEVLDVAAVVAAVRDAVDAFRVPLGAAGFIRVDSVGWVEVNGPSAVAEASSK